ncbi:hypothetical protein RJ639_017200 [Escallonia herrerae]|uniref:BZIP domain-containing protein n=1 Tax=Escallonia herrerae TaxID=1293975 RepID=A0AA89ANE5_9ASTE|nr:hypothetical protein RJ639_017200 [Escallonia herrerae]
MMSTFPAMPFSDGFFGTPFPAFEGGFTPWDCQDGPFLFEQNEPIVTLMRAQEPVFSNSGSDNSNPNPVSPDSGSPGSHEVNRKRRGSQGVNRKRSGSNSGSDDPNRPAYVVDERKRRRMISNRESARRSRMRKQRHLENMRNQVNRFRAGNRELTNRVRLVSHHCQVIRRENDQLRSEAVMLRQKLWEIRQFLLARQLQQSAWACSNVTAINEQNQPPLIT